MRLMNVAAAFCVPWSCIRTNQKFFFVKHISLTFGVGRLIPDNLGSTPRDSWLISYSRDSAWLYSNICSVLMLTGEDLIDSVINLGNVWEECLFWCVIWIIEISYHLFTWSIFKSCALHTQGLGSCHHFETPKFASFAGPGTPWPVDLAVSISIEV